MQAVQVLKLSDFIGAKKQTLQRWKRIEVLNDLWKKYHKTQWSALQWSISLMNYNMLFYAIIFKNIFHVLCEPFSLLKRLLMPYPDAIGAQLQHLQAGEVIQVGNAADFVVKQEKFLHLSQLLQTLHFPQKVKGHVKLPIISQTQMLIKSVFFMWKSQISDFLHHKWDVQLKNSLPFRMDFLCMQTYFSSDLL